MQLGFNRGSTVRRTGRRGRTLIRRNRHEQFNNSCSFLDVAIVCYFIFITPLFPFSESHTYLQLVHGYTHVWFGCGRFREHSALTVQHRTQRGLQAWQLQGQEALRLYWQLCPLCKAMPNARRNHKPTSTSRNSRNLYVQPQSRRSIRSMNHVDIDVAGSLVDDTLDLVDDGCHGRSKAICSDDAEGKGKRFKRILQGLV